MSTVETAHRIAAQFDCGDTHMLQCLTELLKDLSKSFKIPLSLFEEDQRSN